MKKNHKVKKEHLFWVGAFLFFGFTLSSYFLSETSYSRDLVELKNITASVKEVEIPKTKIPIYIETPKDVKALYMTSWIASSVNLRKDIVNILDTTEANAVVIDVKDYSGKIAFEVKNPDLKKFGSVEVRVSDMREFLEYLHQKNIYTIARIAVFQDSHFITKRPDLAVKNLKGDGIWKDKKGISWIDPASREYWDYIVSIGKETREIGFDELNFDYIRYPSDGNMKDISYPWTKVESKSKVLKDFFAYLNENFKGTGVKISADIFGMTTTAKDDLGIGQVLENTLPYFDFVAPMIYPSHYPINYENFKNPAEHPYEVVKIAMQSAVSRAKSASSTPLKYRPWLQDFDLGANYDVAEVKAQIKALNDLGIYSWMMWSPSNKYTVGALLSNEEVN